MISLIPLPYDYSALNPVISTQTLQYHYGKHHAGYVQKTNELIQDATLNEMDLKTLILTAASDTLWTNVFNQAAQVWNHNFYWQSLTNDEGKRYLSDKLLKAVVKNFGSVNKLKQEMVRQGMNQFASGWLWLVSKGKILEVITTPNAQTPLTNSLLTPRLCVDLWEHAYYLDWQNLRKDYLQGVVDTLLNWQFASQNFELV